MKCINFSLNTELLFNTCNLFVITNHNLFLHLLILVLGKPGDSIKEVWSNKGVLITTYNGLLQHINNLLKNSWHYVILDEGHKIRNPDSKVSKCILTYLY